jgi:protein-S-isoprenylcysteine O-methyltransferase Ste14
LEEGIMADDTTQTPTNQDVDTDRAVAARIRQVIGQSVLILAVLIVTSGNWRWTWLWVYVLLSLCLLAVNLRLVPRELIAERGTGHKRENVASWDRVIGILIGLTMLALPVVAGLDQRFGWSPPLPLAVHLLGAAGLVLGQLLFTWSMVSNVFFSTMVRLQTDRGQTVASSGPYRYVRHPGYAGYIIAALGNAVLLGSLWGLVPAAVAGVGMVVRTALEDRTLQEELEGYAEYAQRVRHRLVPGIW